MKILEIIKTFFENINKTQNRVKELEQEKTNLLNDIEYTKDLLLKAKQSNANLEEELKLANIEIDELKETIIQLKEKPAVIKAVNRIVPESKYKIKCTYPLDATSITIHNTANDASARNEISYMTNNTKYTSFHFAVDDKEVVQGLPLNRNAWHAGDGGSGKGNRTSLAIEICYSKSGGDKFDKAEDLAAKLVAQLLRERNWGISKVKRHKDWSGKYCPHRTMDKGWDRFLEMIKNYI